MFAQTTSTLASIILAGLACQWLAWRLRLPIILLLLLAGLLMGPICGLLQPQTLLGELFEPLLFLGMAILLFEGSLSFRLDKLAGLQGSVLWLVGLGALLVGLFITLAGHLLLELPWSTAILFALVALMSGDSELLPLLRHANIGSRLSSLLRQEAGLLAPIAALLAVLLYTWLTASIQSDPLLAFASALLAGSSLGLVSAYLLALALRKHLIPPSLIKVTTLTMVMANFILVSALEYGAGLLSVLIMGMVLANMKDLALHEQLNYRENLSAALLSVLFILLAASLQPTQLYLPNPASLLLLGFILLVARPVAIFIALFGSPLHWRERLLIGWLAPRGLMAIATLSLFALYATEPALSLLPLLLWLVVISLLLQFLTAKLMARLLGLAEKRPRGVLIIGANSTARAIARSLTAEGIQTLLADTDWENIQQARMDGFATYLGHPVSARANHQLDLIGIDYLLAMSHRAALNAQACQRYSREFGAQRVFTLLTAEEKRSSNKSAIGQQYSATRLFGGELSLTDVNSMLARAGAIATLSASELQQQQHHYPLFLLKHNGQLQVIAWHYDKLQDGDRLITLLPPADEPQPLRDDSTILGRKANGLMEATT